MLIKQTVEASTARPCSQEDCVLMQTLQLTRCILNNIC